MSEPASIGAEEHTERMAIRTRLEVFLSRGYARAAEEARARGFFDLAEQWSDAARMWADAPAHTARYVDRLAKQKKGGG